MRGFLTVVFDLWLGGFWACFLTVLAHPPSNRSRHWLLLILAWPCTYSRNVVLQRRSWPDRRLPRCSARYVYYGNASGSVRCELKAGHGRRHVSDRLVWES